MANRSKQRKTPRLLHDTYSTVLLVGAIYKCNKNHTVYSTDPRFIKRIDRILPFILSHRTGFTRAFVHCVNSLVQEGLPMQAVVRHISDLRREYACEMILNLKSDYNVYTGQGLTEAQTLSLATSNYAAYITQPMPTNDAIAKCFIADLFSKEMFYIQQMMHVRVSKCIRLDHTFKVASNIGYLREGGKWVTQYGSVLFVLNEIGQVVTWQLTNSTSFNEIDKILFDLRDRVEVDGSQLTVYVDNCCQVRSKLQKVFGMNTLVKLDLLHAVQRITRAMSKRHALFYPCLNDLRMVFRCPRDIGKTRTISTPDVTIMLTNLNTFLSKWKHVEHNGLKILTDKVLKQINALQTHIERGCLSQIEPGGGTSHNEALHQYINPHFNHAGRMGLPLAYALLTILLYRHNCKKDTLYSQSLAEVLAEKLRVKQKKCVPTHFGSISSTSKHEWLKISSRESDKDTLTTDEGLSNISVIDMERVVRNALSAAKLAETMKSIAGSSPLFSYQMMPFMSQVPSLYFHRLTSTECTEHKTHTDRLSDILEACNMRKHVIEGDGNCCFTAVAFRLVIKSIIYKQLD